MTILTANIGSDQALTLHGWIESGMSWKGTVWISFGLNMRGCSQSNCIGHCHHTYCTRISLHMGRLLTVNRTHLHRPQNSAILLHFAEFKKNRDIIIFHIIVENLDPT